MIGLAQNNNTGRSCPRSTESHRCVQTRYGRLRPPLETAAPIKINLEFSSPALCQTADTSKTYAQTPSDPQPSNRPSQAKSRTVLYGAV